MLIRKNKKMKNPFFNLPKIVLTISFLLGVLFASSQEKKHAIKYEGFSGGMLLHSGYVQGKTFEITDLSGNVVSRQKMEGFPFGIGGAMRIHLGKHWRIGGEGYVSTLKYNHNGSYSSIGWGGILMDCMWQMNKISFFAGGTIGGGSTKNVTLQNDYGNDYQTEENVSFRKYGFMAITPFVGMEYAVTDKIRLTFKIDYLLNVSNFQNDFVTGPRVYIGFMFYRLKNDK